jgi:hypothetical protein
MDITPRNPKRKCIAEECDDCHFFQWWNLVDDKNQDTPAQVCSLDVMFKTLPKLIGSIDGCQAATNRTENTVHKYADASVQALDRITVQINKRLLKYVDPEI